MYDLIIKNGRIFDGSKTSKGEIGDLAVKDGKIVFIGKTDETAETVVDAQGLCVSPGFIDVHAHSEIDCWNDGRCVNKASQGVTTELAGQCGISVYPVFPHSKEDIRKYALSTLGYAEEWPWEQYADYQQELLKRGVAVNQGSFIGQGSIRVNAMGYEDRDPSADELSYMKKLLSKALDDGALGMSTGLVYPPGVFTKTDEIVELARVCAEKGGIYTTHMRDESSRMLEALEEALEIARRSGVQLCVSHLKATGRNNHGKVKTAVQMIEEAAAKGIKVFADSYPYDASSTSMFLVLPPWTMDKGIDGLCSYLADPEKRDLIKSQWKNGIPGWENRFVSFGIENIYISAVETEKNKYLEGKNLAEGACLTGKPPDEFLLDLMQEEKGSVGVVFKVISEEDIRTALGSDRVVVCSDGIDVGSKNHPRLYGSFTRYLRRYADMSCTEGIAAGVNKITRLPADIYHFNDIGRLAVGCRADITIFDPETVSDCATYTEPRLVSKGIEHVFVSGQEIYNASGSTGALPGRIIRRQEGYR